MTPHLKMSGSNNEKITSKEQEKCCKEVVGLGHKKKNNNKPKSTQYMPQKSVLWEQIK
jgi:hypothetical protein